jgi:hypothetical protein
VRSRASGGLPCFLLHRQFDGRVGVIQRFFGERKTASAGCAPSLFTIKVWGPCLSFPCFGEANDCGRRRRLVYRLVE